MYNPYSPFGPVVEVPGEKAFISELPHQIMTKGLAADVPWLCGVATHEGLYPGSGIYRGLPSGYRGTFVLYIYFSVPAEFINNADVLRHIDKNWNEVIPHILDYNYTVSPGNINNVSETIRKEYMSDGDLIKGNTEQFIQVLAQHGRFICDSC